MRMMVPAVLAGERVDRAVATLTGLSRSEVAAMVAAGSVRVSGSLVRAGSRRVRQDEVLDVEVPPAPDPALVADPSVIVEVVHEDPSVIVVDKPAGMVVHPGSGHAYGTLAHGLLARFPELATVGQPDRPGIVHRLDRMTSGLLAVARTAQAFASLTAQLAERTMGRRYLALVWGFVEADAGEVDAPIGRSNRDPTRMAVVKAGRSARTRYQVLDRFADPAPTTLVECRLDTGRTHQIRVHMAAIGHPIVGDNRYGSYRQLVFGPQPALEASNRARPFLHAHHLALDHPASGQRLEVSSRLPCDLAAVLDAIAALKL